MIDVQGVGKQYGNGTYAVKDVNLHIDSGEFLAIVGPSGCGKSTLLRMIAGFESITEGQILVETRPVSGPGPDRGVVFQDYGLFPWLTVEENIAYGPKEAGYPRSQVKELVDKYIDLVGLKLFAKKFPHELSGGMQQRVAIARVLANTPSVMLMDEPFGALDALTREQLQNQLSYIQKDLGITVVFVTHSIEEAVYLADRVVVMGDGAASGVAGNIKKIETISLDGPRDTTSVEFNRYRRDISELIHGKRRRERRANEWRKHSRTANPTRSRRSGRSI
ncbi:ABC transporter ATP-binding protein [Bifidobacterium lemurum]|uniref:ABC transporter ATP-binding protein n=1 Tax=Bifidobacterium lemurum TaxID=1603886 RepID=UPI001D0153E3|nr:ABC transporter ATP-binding protein [Bifidobacterium lemurum]